MVKKNKIIIYNLKIKINKKNELQFKLDFFDSWERGCLLSICLLLAITVCVEQH